MKLTEAVGAKNAIVQILWGDKKLEFRTQIIDKRDQGVLTSVFEYKGAPIELNITPQSPVVCSLFVDEPYTGSRVGWHNLDIQTKYQHDGMFYEIKTSGYNHLSRVADRRNHHRVDMRIQGEVSDKTAKPNVAVLIQDISDNGISFLAPKTFVPRSNHLTVFFEDMVHNRMMNVKVDCVIIRKEERVGNVFFGCQINDANRDYLVYGCLKRLLEQKNMEEGAKSSSDSDAADEALDGTGELHDVPAEGVGIKE